MSRAYPEEFRRDVVEIARRNETPIAQIAKDFGITDAVIRRWLAKAGHDVNQTRDTPKPWIKVLFLIRVPALSSKVRHLSLVRNKFIADFRESLRQ